MVTWSSTEWMSLSSVKARTLERLDMASKATRLWGSSLSSKLLIMEANSWGPCFLACKRRGNRGQQPKVNRRACALEGGEGLSGNRGALPVLLGKPTSDHEETARGLIRRWTTRFLEDQRRSWHSRQIGPLAERLLLLLPFFCPGHELLPGIPSQTSSRSSCPQRWRPAQEPGRRRQSSTGPTWAPKPRRPHLLRGARSNIAQASKGQHPHHRRGVS